MDITLTITSPSSHPKHLKKKPSRSRSMMSWSHEVESPVSAARLFKAAILDWHNLAPKLAPQIVVSAAPLQGNGGAGSVRQLNFSPVMPFGYMKERLDFVDHEKFESKQTLIEGGDLEKKLASASSHFKFEPTSGGGCICKVVATYEALPGVEVMDEATTAKEMVTGMIKAAEAYLLAHPGAYA